MVKQILIAFLIAFIVQGAMAQHDPLFKRITIENGLSHNSVRAILKDRYGFMWFGTSDGLNRYDGVRMNIYKSSSNDPSSLSNDGIYCLYEDRKGNLWIGTNGGGLSLYRRDTDSFVNFRNSLDSASLSDNSVTSICEDQQGKIWVGTFGGLNMLDPATFTVQRIHHDPNDPQTISGIGISSIVADREGLLWIGTHDDGLNLFNPRTLKNIRFRHDPAHASGISSNRIMALYSDTLNRIWIGTLDGGLDRFENGSFVHYRYDPKKEKGIPGNAIMTLANGGGGKVLIGFENGGVNVYDPGRDEFTSYGSSPDENSLNSQNVLSIYQDKQDILWLGTNTAGIYYLDSNEPPFRYYSNIKLVNAFAEDPDGMIWIATDGGGIDLLNPRNKKVTDFNGGADGITMLNNNVVVSLMCDRNGNMWIGTYGGGVNVYDRKKKTWRYYIEGTGDDRLTNNRIYALEEDNQGRIWIGTLGGGLNILNKTTGKISKYLQDRAVTGSISNNYISSIAKDHDARMWVGTFGSGLNHYDDQAGNFIHYNSSNSALSSNLISVLFVDKDNNLWIGTLGGGLNFFDSEKKQFTTYRETEGLINDFIHSIEQDESGNLWMSTNYGLSKLDIATRTFTNYEMLRRTDFRTRAGFKTKHGELLFGGAKGFNIFRPEDIKSNVHIPPVVITGLQIFNQPVSVRTPGSPLKKSIFETEEIVLSHKQSVFTFQFAALNYTLPAKNQYAYKLEGFDQAWNHIGIERKTTYTNLDPGEYTFHVKASNNDGLWNEKGTSIKIIITPPFWKTWWFRGSIFLLFAASVYTFFKIRINLIQHQKEKLEHQVQERTSLVSEQKQTLEAQARHLQKLNQEQQVTNKQLQATAAHLEKANEELNQQKKKIIIEREEAEKARKEAERANQAKSIFLATMSHEIRTPMNGVLGMASLLAETSLTAEQKEYTDTIINCGDTLLTVINDVLDFSKIESGNIELEHHSFDLRHCIENVMDLFVTKASEKGIDLIYEINYEIPAQIVGDSHRLRQILINLVGNAMKFTQQGEIFVGINLLNHDKDTLELAFEVRDSGIGIPGEQLSKLFKAFSQADSSTTRKYGGTGLGLAISRRLIELMGGSISVESNVGVGTTFSFAIKAGVSQQALRQYVNCNMAGNEGKRVLLVDDNLTNLAILKNQLEQWKLLPTLATSGKAALAILKEVPAFDLVITDMQMPHMDGIQLTNHIKAKYTAVPVVLLSSVGDDNKSKYRDLFSSVLNKPVKQHELCRVIQIALRSLNVPGIIENPESKRILSKEFAKKHPMRILIVEDNPVNQKLATRTLNKLGYEATDIEIAENGEVAVEKISKHFYPVVLMDIQMPVMDGLEATRIIRSMSAQQPIIICMTANVMQDDRAICMKAGMNDYISKPIKLEEFVNALETASASFA